MEWESENGSSPEPWESLLREFSRKQVRYTRWESALVLAGYLPLFLLAAAANTLLIYVVSKYKYMHNVTNYFLVNLSVADLLVTLICMPAAMGQSISSLWLLGDTMCKLTFYLQGVSVGASVFTLTAMSIDRYLAIRHSMAFRKVFNNQATLRVVLALWIVPLIMFSPLLWVRKTAFVEFENEARLNEAARRHGLVWCYEDWGARTQTKKIYGVACFVLVYASPGCVVILAYALMGRSLWSVTPPFDREESTATIQQVRVVQERRRAARMLLVLATLFTLCWLPYNILALILDLDIGDQEWVMEVFPFALFLGHANSAINPLLYSVMTRNFRRSVRTLFLRRRRPKRTHSCKVCCRFQQRAVTSSSGYESCGQNHGRDQTSRNQRCLVLTSLRQNAGASQHFV